jgi:hypothetical protein
MSFEVPNLEVIKKKKEESKKRKISGIVAAGVAGIISASAEGALAENRYVPDEEVVGQKEYVVPGVVDSGKVSGATEAGMVEGAIKNDGKIYREEKMIKDSDDAREIDMSNMRRGGKIVIDGREYGIEK